MRVAQDEVVLTLGVETWYEDLKAAKRANDVRDGVGAVTVPIRSS